MPHTKLTRTRSVVVTTCFVVFLASLIGGMGAHVITTMARSANAIDDERAERAAQSAIFSMKYRLGATVRDNAVWDETYEAITNGDAVKWTYESWGRTSEDYLLYDAVAVTGPDGANRSAYWKAQPFNPIDYFGPSFVQQVKQAATHAADPVINFYAYGDRVLLVASQAIQSFTPGNTGPAYNVLSFFKIFTPKATALIAKEYLLEGLELTASPNPSLLNVPLNDQAGKPLAFLSWPSKQPGTKVYQSIHLYILASILLLALFVAAVIAAGGAEARRLRKLAILSRFQATHDSLTGLYNRLGLVEKLDQLLKMKGNRQRLALHMIDLDGFKPVNDAWGHAVGDRLLAHVATALTNCHSDVVASARIGGDEFALIQLGLTDPEEVGRAVLSVFRTPFIVEGRTIEVGATIGSALEEDVRDPHELLRRADMALYEGKESGRARFVSYSPRLDEEREKLIHLEGDLRRAIESGEIHPLFQPLVCAKTGEVKGVEALARWHRGDKPVGPDVFIPLAEKAGLIEVLGLQMLRLSVRAAKTWPQLSLSVNVSPIQLCNPAFAADIQSLLAEEEFDPRRLVLEITENVLMSNPDQAKRAIDALKASGIRFALDDFGCGYASIGALRQFGFDRMKIDRSLVLAADRDASGIDVLKATISLASALGIPVTAEGIETGRQADVLRAAGCDQLQGYLVGRPMPPADISEAIVRAAKAA